MYDILYRCPTCGNCSIQCENNLPTVDINEALRACLYEQGAAMNPKHEGIRKLIEGKNNPYNEDVAVHHKVRVTRNVSITALSRRFGGYTTGSGLRQGWFCRLWTDPLTMT